MRIGLDVDGVMYHFQKTYCYMMNTMKGYNLDYNQWSHWNWPEKEGGVSKADKKWIWSEGVDLGLFRYGHLYRGTIEAVRALAKLGDPVVITHRPASAVQDTLDWLAYLRLPFKEVHLLTENQPKSIVKCDLYVDDKPENITDFHRNTRGVAALWRRPWNTEMEPFHVVNTWEEVIKIAKSIKG